MISRREFIRTAASMAALAGAGLPISAFAQTARRKRRYVTCTASPYWGKAQNFGIIRGIKKIQPSAEVVSLTNSDSKKVDTLFTIVDEDGGNVRRFSFPSGFHAATSSAESGLIYLISDHLPKLIIALDIDTLEVVRQFTGKDSSVTNFTGHGVPLPGGAMAFGINFSKEIGRYGAISIRDARTFRELDRFPSYGFDFHELRLTPDGKYFVCGHYGSYLGHWQYKSLIVYGGYDHPKITPPEIIYPGSVTLVDVKNGQRFRLLSDVDGGQQGHADSDEEYRAYLACARALVQNRANNEANPKFAEGKKTQPDGGEFSHTQIGAGISVAYDPLFHEALVPYRNASCVMLITDTRTQKRREVDLLPQLGWKKPTEDFIHGLAFHPDGKHYILSTTDGFIAVSRGTHRVNKAMTLRIPLLIHTHVHIV